MRINNLFLLIPLCFTVFTNDIEIKGDKVPGYITLLTGEKVDGEIIPGTVTDNEVKVIFFASEDSKKKVYKPTELLGYGYQDNEDNDFGFDEPLWIHYEKHKVDYPPKPFGSTTVFIQKEVDGALTLLCYYVEVRNDVKNPYRYTYYIKDNDGQIKKIEQESFRGTAKSLFTNYSALSSRIGQKDFQYRNLDRMVRDFNYWSVNQHNSDEYRVALKQ